MSIELINDIFKQYQEKTFAYDVLSRAEYRYGDIEIYSKKLALYLSEHFKLRAGDRVAVILPNSIEFVLFLFACIFGQFTCIPINSKLTLYEISDLIKRSQAHFFTTTSLIDQKKTLSREFAEMPFWIIDLFPARSIWHKIESISSSQIDPSPPFINELFSISFTSGTTATPKGVTIQYTSCFNNGREFIETLQISDTSRFFTILPHAYMGGWYNLTLIPFLAGASVVIGPTFGPELAFRFWDMVRTWDVTTLWFTPSIIAALLSLDREDDSLKKITGPIFSIVGTAPLSEVTRVEFERRFPVILYENYGLSETFFLSTNRPGIPRRGVGLPLPSCSIHIIDKAGDSCATGQVGLITASTPFVSDGYLNDLEETNNLVRGNTVYTGDTGYLDEDGYLYITGRQKEIIIKGGINISPLEIENVLKMHPAVIEAVVCAVPDPIAGEDIAAVVQVRENIDIRELKEFSAHYLAPFKVPKVIEFMQSFPMTSTGKIQRKKVCEHLFNHVR